MRSSGGIDWAGRAEQAERAVLARHLRAVFWLPGTRLGLVSWPARQRDRWLVRWDFWWQAQLLDCMVDAWLREPDPVRARRIRALVRSVKLRNLGRFTNDYYDDMAWMGLALQRAEPAGVHEPAGISRIVTKILDAWAPPTGGIPWRVGDDYYNAPANGPAAILLARSGFPGRARQTVDWMNAALRLPGSDLLADGLYAGHPPRPVYYSYVQGVTLGAELELAKTGASRSAIHRLVAAVDGLLTTAGVLRGHGGDDGGLFTGILARYLAVVATDLPGDDPADRVARSAAARLVLDSAEAAWGHRQSTAEGPLFGPDWTRTAVLPRRGGADTAERDLSVQLSGWMLSEAAAVVAGSPAPTIRSGDN